MLSMLLENKEDNYREEVLELIISNGKPVLIYGTAKFAMSVADYLVDKTQSMDIIWGFTEPKEYWYEGKYIYFRNKRYDVWSENVVIQRAAEYNVISGILEYSILGNRLKKKFSQCDIVEYLDVYPNHKLSFSFLDVNKRRLQSVYDMLQDMHSKRVYRAFLEARFTGNVSVIGELCESKWSYDWELLGLNFGKQVIVDCGAYRGDTIMEVLENNFQVDSIYAFEPDRSHYDKLCQVANDYSDTKIVCSNKGLWENTTVLRVSESNTLSSAIMEDGNVVIPCTSLDEALVDVDDISIIKMDIEGSELCALRGCKKLIARCAPNLAICIYHKPEDIFTIPLYIRELVEQMSSTDYKYYIRQHSYSVEETVFYAIAQK